MVSEVTIEQAQASDIDAILAIENLCFETDRFSRRQFTYLIKKAKGVFLVGKLNGKVVAYMSLLVNRTAGKLRIYSIAVHPDNRGLKLAHLLLNEAIAIAREKGLKILALEVRTDNFPAISLYEKNGFIKTSVKPHYYEDGTDAHVMHFLI